VYRTGCNITCPICAWRLDYSVDIDMVVLASMDQNKKAKRFHQITGTSTLFTYLIQVRQKSRPRLEIRNEQLPSTGKTLRLRKLQRLLGGASSDTGSRRRCHLEDFQHRVGSDV
jgi:hypothetical protein